MSLKSFHIFFICASILLLIGFGAWFLVTEPVSAGAINVLGGLICFSLAGGLGVYAVRFLQKFKSLTNQ